MYSMDSPDDSDTVSIYDFKSSSSKPRFVITVLSTAFKMLILQFKIGFDFQYTCR